MRLCTLLVLLAASPAVAQPDAPGRCQVGVSRAPDDVRAAIAQWVNAEPRCATSLEVRVIPTEGGYYVIAQSGNGRVFERVVPDAQAVGVLVASWAADDTAIAPPMPDTTPEVLIRPPSTVPPRVLEPMAVKSVAPAPARAEQRWLAIGAMSQVNADDTNDTATDSRAVRVDIDLFRRGSLSAGAGVALMQSSLVMFGGSSPWGYIDTDDVRAIGSVAYTHRSGKWAFRASGGLGFIYTSGSGTFDSMPVHAEGLFPTLEVAAVAARDLTASWGVLAGPVITAYKQDYVFSSGTGGNISLGRSEEISLYAALLRRL